MGRGYKGGGRPLPGYLAGIYGGLICKEEFQFANIK